MENLLLLPNGQWILEKSITAQSGSATRNWQHSGNRRYMDKIPRLEGRQRHKAIDNISKDTKTRVNPKTQQKEFLMHRATKAGDKFHLKNKTSWTTNESFTHHWVNAALSGESEPALQTIMHAWVPEEHVHAHLPTISGYQAEKEEGEVIVNPHNFNIFHQTSGKDSQLQWQEKYGKGDE